ncbi:hypothetical protein K0M31_004756 [Melipona bicolor]|uniref:Uncharacterized protein n=1 Tax=Melipona bicolor TaxID=60889 RepID=A0AA40KMP2_9HYME|nr:hypothetical protein K0M31_004756 [Melipona bicolor]
MVSCNLLEPVSSKAPAFTGVLKGGYMEIKSRTSVVFFCPAQGYPVPSFRNDLTKVKRQNSLIFGKVRGSIDSKRSESSLFLIPRQSRLPRRSQSSRATRSSPGTIVSPVSISLCFVLLRGSQFHPTEPVGSKAPAFTGTVKGVWMENQADTDVVLFCPAQGYPVPSFRALIGPNCFYYVALAFFSFALVPSLDVQSGTINSAPLIACALLEPVGSKAPAFIGDVKGVWLEKGAGSSVVLPCPAQGYPVPSFRFIALFMYDVCVKFVEPIGTKAPAFTSELKGGWLKKRAKSSAVLSCPAQGHPVPSFR